RERTRPERVDPALVVADRRLLAVPGAARHQRAASRPRHVVPGERLESVLAVMRPNVPEAPAEQGLADDLHHTPAGSSAGCSTGAGMGTGSSFGTTSISRSVSGSPMSICPRDRGYEEARTEKRRNPPNSWSVPGEVGAKLPVAGRLPGRAPQVEIRVR